MVMNSLSRLVFVFLTLLSFRWNDRVSLVTSKEQHDGEDDFLTFSKENLNEFSDDYENFQEIIISYFNSLKERGEKINIPMITKIISGEYTCPTDELVREIDAERIAAINDRDSLYTRLEQLDEQLIKVEGQVRVRDYELQILHKEVLHQREIIRTYENQKLIHELSVQQHCTELVQDLSTCRGELTSYFEDRNHMTQLRADYEYMNQKFSECRRTLQELERHQSQESSPSCENPTNHLPSNWSKILVTNVKEKIFLLFNSSQKCMWDCFVALQSLLSPYLTILEQQYHVHLHPFYLQYLHPTVQYVYRQYLIFLNTPVMVEVLAYLDFLTRKMHVLLYRIEMDLPRYYHSMSRFLSIVLNRMIWNTDRLLNKLASSLSRSPICNIFGPDEWYLIINIGIIAGIGLLVFALRRLIYSLIRWILRVIISPFQYLVMLIFRKRPNSIPQANSNSS